jgi:hypothetical protein
MLRIGLQVELLLYLKDYRTTLLRIQRAMGCGYLPSIQPRCP